MVFKMQTLQNDIRRTCICFLHQPTPQALGSQPEATAVARVPYGNIWIKVSLGFAFKKNVHELLLFCFLHLCVSEKICFSFFNSCIVFQHVDRHSFKVLIWQH